MMQSVIRKKRSHRTFFLDPIKFNFGEKPADFSDLRKSRLRRAGVRLHGNGDAASNGGPEHCGPSVGHTRCQGQKQVHDLGQGNKDCDETLVCYVVTGANDDVLFVYSGAVRTHETCDERLRMRVVRGHCVGIRGWVVHPVGPQPSRIHPTALHERRPGHNSDNYQRENGRWEGTGSCFATFLLFSLRTTG